jgi:hypothetical protein
VTDREIRPDDPSDDRRRSSPLTILILVGMALLLLIALSAFLPRWWSHRIADQANGSFASGISLGLFYGFVFTVVALAIAWFGLRRVHTWKGRLVVLGVALLVAAPNLLTLSIVLGVGNASHAGERTLDVEAPGFRASSLVGAVGATLALGALALLLRSRRRSREDADALRTELSAHGSDTGTT